MESETLVYVVLCGLDAYDHQWVWGVFTSLEKLISVVSEVPGMKVEIKDDLPVVTGTYRYEVEVIKTDTKA